MKERLGALITELVVAAVRFGRCNTRRHCFERLLFAQTGQLESNLAPLGRLRRACFRILRRRVEVTLAIRPLAAPI